MAPAEPAAPFLRPWQALLGVKLAQKEARRIDEPAAAAAAAESEEEPEREELSPVERLLPDELLLAVFTRLPISSVGAAACDWRALFLDRPHLRFDGVYVSRNTYLKQGAPEWRRKASSVALVVWYRYLRFFPDGTFAYRTSPHTVARIARTLAPAAAEPAGRRGAAAAADGAAQHGRWRLDAGGRLLTAMRYANSAATEVRCRLGLRSTCRGAHNRLDIAQIVSYDAASGEAVPVPLDAGDVEVDGFERRASTRGMGVYVLVRDEDVATSVLNLPIDKMDLWLPG